MSLTLKSKHEKALRVAAILRKIKYKDWGFVIGKMDDGCYIQVTFLAPDTLTGKVERQYCRKWYVSPHSIDTEIVGTAWFAIQRAEIHESEEIFLYQGKAIFSSHVNIKSRLRIADDLDFRKRG